jgi:uncharacterized alkaline shock family protein YloU
MNDRQDKLDSKKVDPKEFEFPETVFVRDIENRVFQGIVLQVLADIDGISLIEGNFIDHLLGRNALESVKGILADQDIKNHTIGIKVEVNVRYGISIPEKAEEIQTKIAEKITELTGLHVSSVHVVFKNVVTQDKEHIEGPFPDYAPSKRDERSEYSDEF